MKKVFCYFKALDVVICVTVLALALLCFLSFSVLPKEGGTLLVFADGRTAEYSLEVDRRFTVEASGHTLEIEIKDGAARVVASTCHDGTCLKKGSISKAGETVLCAPAGVLLKVVRKDGGDCDASVG